MHAAELKRAILALEWQVAAERVLLAGKRLAALLSKANFNPAQPRVPAGNADGGRWTDTGFAADSSSRARVYQAGARGPSSVSVRTGRGTLDATPGQAARLAIADMSARESARQVREIDPAWHPRPSLTDPNSVEGAIRRAEGEAREAQSRLAELARARFGDNHGPRLDPPGPRSEIGTPSIEPFQAIRAYRSITGMPDIGDRPAGRSSEGTVAFTTVDDVPIFGVNSDAPGYTARDETMARDMRARLIGRYPEMMATGNVGHIPNNALFHAEANALMRAAESSGGSLAGRTIILRVDREICRSCKVTLPGLGIEIGNPTVRIVDGTGAVWIMRDGVWIKRGQQ